jgi:hypothetical protein
MRDAGRDSIRAIAAERGCRYRITRTGEVHFYGQMPNTNAHGWYFIASSVEDALRRR